MEQRKETVREHQLVVFTLAGESYGINVSAVREIIRMQSVTRVPGAPSYVEGVINLRGKIIPMVDLRKRFGLEVTERNNNSRIVVVESQRQHVGIIVDAVTEVLRISNDVVEEVSSTIASEATQYLMGIGKLKDRLIVMLDIGGLLSLSEVSTALREIRDAQRTRATSPNQGATVAQTRA